MNAYRVRRTRWWTQEAMPGFALLVVVSVDRERYAVALVPLLVTRSRAWMARQLVAMRRVVRSWPDCRPTIH